MISHTGGHGNTFTYPLLLKACANPGLWNPKIDQRKIIPPGITDDEPGFDRRREHIDNASVAYLNGICHWWGSEYATNGLEEEQVLVSFNLSTETFQITSIVWLQENDDSPIRSLVVLNKSVTLISSFAKNNRIEISILGEVGVKESWVKLFTLEPFPSKFCYPMRMGDKCDLIFFIRNHSSELASFDVITGKVIHNINIKASMFGTWIYKESIFSFIKEIN
ncbi:hypothetical protein AHAS_Ahas05G0179600 [Arachis hypogaea]